MVCVTETTNNDLGRPQIMSGAGIPATAWQYDGRGRVISVKSSANGQVREQTYDYDDGGWVEYFTNALAEETRYSRDAVGRLKELESPDKGKTYWVLDDADNVTSLTPPGHPETLFSYDTKSKLVTHVAPPRIEPAKAGNVAFTYGKENELTKLTRADGKSIVFTYDSMNRLTSQKLGSATLSYGYSNGHLTRINHSNGVTLNQTFDGALWTGSSWSGGITGNVKATYDENLWLSSLTVNDGSTVSFSYDDDGLLISATATAGVVTLTRAATTGYVTGSSIGNTTGQQGYTDFGEVNHISAAFAGATLFEQNLVERDALGRIRHLTETVQGTPHDVYSEYDVAGRLAKETRDGVVTVYTYDLSGNRTSLQVGSSAAVTATYDEQDRVLTYGTATYQHDTHGDLKTRTDGTKSLTLTYDELGNLLKATTAVGTTTKLDSPDCVQYDGGIDSDKVFNHCIRRKDSAAWNTLMGQCLSI